MIILNISLILLIIYIHYKFKENKEDFINLTVNVNPPSKAEEEEMTHEQVMEKKVEDLYSYKELDNFYKSYLKDQKEMMNLVTNPKIDMEVRSGCDLICKAGYINMSPDFWN